MRPRRIVSLLALSAISVLATPVSAGLIFFDDFASDTLGLGVTELTHWNVTQGEVDVLACDIDAGDGNCMDLRGATITTKQALLITIPGIYEIAFSVVGGTDPFEVSVGDFFSRQIRDYTFPLHTSITLAAMPLILTSVNLFQVITQAVHIGFRGLATTSDGPVLSSVSFRHITAVPEPPTLLLLGIGFVGLLAARLARKAGEARIGA